VDYRILAALAYFSFHLAARLPLRAARRQSQGCPAYVRKLADSDGAGRTLAWRVLEFRDLGGHSRRDAGRRANARKRKHISAPPRNRKDGGHVRDRVLCLGILSRRHTAQGACLLRESGWIGAPAIRCRVAWRRDLSAVLHRLARRSGRGYMALSPDVGF